MERIIVSVTVKRADESRVRDVELSAHVPVEELVLALTRKFGWELDTSGNPIQYRVETYPTGITLQPGQTLAQADTWDGSWLVLHPSEGTAPSAPRASASPAADAPAPAPDPAAPSAPGPLKGFRPLDLAQPSTQKVPAPPPADGYVWKRVDDDP